QKLRTRAPRGRPARPPGAVSPFWGGGRIAPECTGGLSGGDPSGGAGKRKRGGGGGGGGEGGGATSPAHRHRIAPSSAGTRIRWNAARGRGLIEGLAALGHRISLLAPRGTRVPGATVIDVPAAVLLGREGDVRSHVPAGAEILHAHYVVARPPAGVAFVQTLHGNPAAGEALPPNTVFLSWTRGVRHGATTFAYNGLNPAR